MRSSRRLAGASIVFGMACVFSTTALDARLQEGPVDLAPPTAIEEALIEHACGGFRPAGAPETDTYLACRQNQLVSLRNEFGKDLKRLSNAERRTIDSACNGLRASRGPDAYLACLSAQLASLRGRGSRARPDAPGDAVISPVVPPPAASPPPSSSSGSRGLWIGTALVVLVLAGAGGAFVVRRNRLAFGACRTCGVKLVERGNLCHNCRHEAAEALRRATAERADQARAQEEEQRRQAEREEEQRQQRARDEETQRQLEEAHQEQARQQEVEAQRRRDEEARNPRQADTGAGEGESDPYTVLGLPKDASVEALEAAYQEARAKYRSGSGRRLEFRVAGTLQEKGRGRRAGVPDPLGTPPGVNGRAPMLSPACPTR